MVNGQGDWDMKYAIGLDYGTNSVRCVIVDTANGRELGTCVYEYPDRRGGDHSRSGGP